jgi:hypothetical protein
MPPEVLNRLPHDPFNADVWGLGTHLNTTTQSQHNISHNHTITQSHTHTHHNSSSSLYFFNCLPESNFQISPNSFFLEKKTSFNQFVD